MTSTRRNLLATCLLLAVLLAGVAALLWQQVSAGPRTGKTQTACAPALNAASPSVRAVNIPAERQAAPLAVLWRAKARVVNEQGKPLAGLGVSWRAAINAPPETAGRAETEAAGNFEVPLYGHYPLLFRSENVHWMLQLAPITPQTDKAIELVARDSVTIRLSIVGAEDEPYIGDASIRVAKKGGAAMFQRELRFKGDGPVEIEQVPLGRALRVNVRASMKGYDTQQFDIGAERLIAGEVIVLKLVKSPRENCGVIELDLSQWRGVVSHIDALPEGSLVGVGASGTDRINKDKIWVSRPIPAGTYYVRLRGRPDWESAPFVLLPRQTYRLAPDEYLPASVTVKVFDESNMPMAGATLTRDVTNYMSYMFGKDGPWAEEGVIAKSDGAGQARISGIRPGAHQFLVEAYGYEPQVLSLRLRGGETTDGGSVYLRKAIGRITVVLKNRKPGMTYSIDVLKPGGGGCVQSEQSVNTGEQIFDSLPLRPYLICAAAGKGGRATSADVTLSPDKPGVTIEIDVGELVEGYPDED
jgi:hypothetical protein